MLLPEHGAENVGTELDKAGGQVDLVVRRANKYCFYEIKTAISARGCIREALAQLLEYSFWPGAQEAEKLIVVGEPSLDQDAEQYLVRASRIDLKPDKVHAGKWVRSISERSAVPKGEGLK